MLSFSRRIWRISLLLTLVGALSVASLYYFGIGAGSQHAKAAGPSFNTVQKRLLSGLVASEIYPQNQLKANTATKTSYYPHGGDDQCSGNRGSNIKVNQNCVTLTDSDLQGRGQANNETSISIDPNNPDHIVVSDNDYRRGDGSCITEYSLDGGKNWNDVTVPMSFSRGTNFGGYARQYWQSGGDTSVAWDTKGNAYLACQVFNRGAAVSSNPDASSAVYLYRSTQNAGASWNFTGRPTIEYYDPTGTAGVLEDKPYMTVDNHIGSPFQDHVYVTYTEFAADGTGYIWATSSADYGEHFGPRVLVSKSSPLCTQDYGFPTKVSSCNENQDSQPFTGPDGALYVVYSNYNGSAGNIAPDAVTANSPVENYNQVFLVKSTDGGATFSDPVKVTDFYDLPDCDSYQGAGTNPGYGCVPEKGTTTNSKFRANNYPVGAVNPKDKNQVVVTIGSYINAHSNESNGCVPKGYAADGQALYDGVKTAGACNNDIIVSTSNDGGTSFTGTTTNPRNLAVVTSKGNQTSTDQFWQWSTFSSEGKLVVSYYDRQYGDDETKAYSDISLSVSKNYKFDTFDAKRVTTDSMPPATQFRGQFLGDYAGLAVANHKAYPAWADTRDLEYFLCPNTGTTSTPPGVCTASALNADLAHDENIYVASVDLW